MKINGFYERKFFFLKNTLICTRLRGLIFMIVFNMLTQKCYFVSGLTVFLKYWVAFGQ